MSSAKNNNRRKSPAVKPAAPGTPKPGSSPFNAPQGGPIGKSKNGKRK